MIGTDFFLRIALRAALTAVVVLVVGFSALPPGAARAQEPLPCGTLYRVQPGDTLHSIAVRAYGEGNYLAIFEANRDVLPSVTRIEVNDQLLIPCLDGSGPRTRSEFLPAATDARETVDEAGGGEPATVRPKPATALAALPSEREIVLLTGPDFAPFVDPALPEGGLTPELIRLAFARVAPERRVRVMVAEDWGMHLDLLVGEEVDLGFPWYRPDCARAARLGPSMQRRCAEFAFSAPLYEVAVGWYVRAGGALAEAVAAAAEDSPAAALEGRRICRPASYFTFDLRQAGLVPPRATLVFPPTAEECFVLLEAGVVDAVTLAESQAEPELTRLGLGDAVVAVPALGSVETLHAIAPKSSPAARAMLAALDAGLAELKDSGRWFEVVARHLGPFGVSLR